MSDHYLGTSQPAVPNVRDYIILRDLLRLGDRFDHLFRDPADREVLGYGKHYSPGRDPANQNNTVDFNPNNHIRIDTAPATPDAERWQGWGTALKPAHEPVVVARRPLAGTVAANVLAHGTGALNIDGCRAGRR
jgi:hypothetical protein